MTQLTVLTGPERRRRWSEADRRRILSAAFSPGAVVTDVARQFDVSTALIYKWRQQARAEVGEAMFVPVTVADGLRADQDPASPATIVVDLACGSRVSIGGNASPALVTAALRALR